MATARKNSPVSGTDEFARSKPGVDVESLGTSDNSDSGSDVVGAYSQEHLDSTTGSRGTGERGTLDDGTADGADIAPDKIVGPDRTSRLDPEAQDALVDEIVTNPGRDRGEI